ncbi:RNA 2',3'-cyclic phosphodiesterase [Desertibacillus haloalkaliphilus]|uniref:RNA 2',3'-cyclic phosphodiesterase n=1 Tax=Desertibacillus haloalkaliphilus TaxID=1328930 RepID=UPI001C27D7AD|nr:RNA 2',3'-cyclic phosphodiesterase [Desertibacillus haloalkaliphilus]MBU8905260.1 RNA 2',3'-cyclic phosphodiesterase [Desertibacillus haloalkaliphilus]
MTNQKTHFFLALPLAIDVRESLARWSQQLAENVRFKTWVHPADLHITLAFLGHAEFPAINALKKQLTPVIAGHQSFSLAVDQLGTFGSKTSPRILWAGLNYDQALLDLQRDVRDVCNEIGFQLDQRPYRPHITLARRWLGDERFTNDELMKSMRPHDGVYEWQVREAVLYQTHMRRTPKYQPLTIFQLGQ